jgi:hypothetical protein
MERRPFRDKQSIAGSTPIWDAVWATSEELIAGSAVLLNAGNYPAD